MLNNVIKPEVKKLLPVTEKLEQGINQQVVNARDLWKFLENSTRFNDWFKRNVKEYGFKKNKDYFCYSNLSNKEHSKSVHSLTLKNVSRSIS